MVPSVNANLNSTKFVSKMMTQNEQKHSKTVRNSVLKATLGSYAAILGVEFLGNSIFRAGLKGDLNCDAKILSKAFKVVKNPLEKLVLGAEIVYQKALAKSAGLLQNPKIQQVFTKTDAFINKLEYGYPLKSKLYKTNGALTGSRLAVFGGMFVAGAIICKNLLNIRKANKEFRAKQELFKQNAVNN